MAINVEKLCEQHLVPAYIDGELAEDVQTLFEDHLDECDECRMELRAHQQFICELDAAMNDQVGVSVPANFSRVVAARAVSDMRGVRSSAEKKRALTFCLILAITGFALIGTTARQMTIGLFRRLIGKV